MTDQEHIAALYSRLNAFKMNAAEALAMLERARNDKAAALRAATRLNTAFSFDESAARKMNAKLYPKGEEQ
jgi:hypothetical protein